MQHRFIEAPIRQLSVRRSACVALPHALFFAVLHRLRRYRALHLLLQTPIHLGVRSACPYCFWRKMLRPEDLFQSPQKYPLIFRSRRSFGASIGIAFLWRDVASFPSSAKHLPGCYSKKGRLSRPFFDGLSWKRHVPLPADAGKANIFRALIKPVNAKTASFSQFVERDFVASPVRSQSATSLRMRFLRCGFHLLFALQAFPIAAPFACPYPPGHSVASGLTGDCRRETRRDRIIPPQWSPRCVPVRRAPHIRRRSRRSDTP